MVKEVLEKLYGALNRFISTPEKYNTTIKMLKFELKLYFDILLAGKKKSELDFPTV